MDPIGAENGRLIEVGDSVPKAYFLNRLYFADADQSTNWPFYLAARSQAVDRIGNPLNDTSAPITQFWRDRVLGSNRVSIKSIQNLWHTKTVCVDIPKEKKYTIFIGADNQWNLKINGADYAGCHEEFCYVDGRFISQTLKSGKNLVEMKYLDTGVAGALWYEIYDQSMGSVQSATTDADLNTIFSTKSLVGSKWDYSGQDICPAGYAFDVCAKDKRCSKLEKASCQ